MDKRELLEREIALCYLSGTPLTQEQVQRIFESRESASDNGETSIDVVDVE